MAKQRYTTGNVSFKGFVNVVDGRRVTIGTGSYTDRNDNKVYKESISVFLDDKYDGHMPAKGEYIFIKDVDLNFTARKDKPDEYSGAVNVRFANQVEKLETPQRREAAPAGNASDDDI
ncbi:hypothetical protein [Comamonas thiooxydans]|uniref:hypothetical protein n=1 Tax=Comamonas thiooxydans TaxID=363952 RepID=UPI000B40A684|nr:hypothetical protein [Comamonas thiooxydans]